MNKAFFLQLVFNASLLLTLTLIYNLVAVQWRIGRASLRQVPVGIVIGIMGVIVMLVSWQLQPGIIFDTRSILLAVSGLFFGTIPTVVAMAITIAFRGSMGGVAVGMGIAVILTSGAIGIAWRHMRRPFLADITWRELYLFGMIIHLAMLGCAFILPGATKWYVLANVALPVILICPAVTAVLGKLMADQLKRERTNRKLRESEERYQTLAKIAPVGIFRTDQNGATTYVNPMWCRISGLPEAEALGEGWLAAVHPDDRESLSKGWQETVLLQKPSLADYRFIRLDGTVAWVMGQATPEMNSENQIVGYVGTITDISERKRAEQELHESEAQYRAFFNTSRDCVFITSLTGRWLYMNDAAVDLFGYASRAELSQVNISDHFANPEEWAKYISIMLEQGYTKEFPVDLRRKDGVVIQTLLTAVPRYDADGNVTGFQGTIRDITERKRAQDALRENEERFRSLYENSTIGIYRTNPAGKIIMANPALVKMLGFSSFAELASRRLGDDWFESSFPRQRFLEKFAEHDEVIGLEAAWKRRDGSTIYVSEGSHAVRDAQGVIVHFDGTVEDISERKRAEVELLGEKAFLEKLVETAPEGIAITDCQGRVLQVNSEFVRMFGYGVDEAVGKKIDDLEAPPEYLEEAGAITKSAGEGKKIVFETVRKRKDGTLFHVSIICAPIRIAEQQVAVYAIFRDITERKRAEEMIRASLAEKEVLLKEVHHRVKNNLMTIIGLIKMQETKANNEMFNPLLQELEGRIRSMALVHESLHKSESLARIDLQNYIETLSANIRAQFGAERDIRFSVQAAGVDVNLDIAVPCGLILNELITNAYKHAFPKDKPRAGESNCEIAVSVKHESGGLTLTVADNGVGLPPGTDWENPGTLGLQLVKMLSQQLNGSIELDRTSGTTFHLRFAHSSGAN